MNRNSKDKLIGQVFTRLTVISFSHIGEKNGGYYWLCQCVCGKFNTASTGSLKSKAIQSCGCLNEERKRTHGFTHHPLYTVWHSMVTRCTFKKHRSFSSYGGRGITICSDWLNDNKTFFDWCLANGWQKGLQLDRIDPNGNYEPNNCRFITPKENAANKRNTVRITHNGVAHTMMEWSEILGIPIIKIRGRHTKKMPPHKILSQNPLKIGRYANRTDNP